MRMEYMHIACGILGNLYGIRIKRVCYMFTLWNKHIMWNVCVWNKHIMWNKQERLYA